MELGDFAFFAWAPVLLIPLAATYLSLRKLGWPKDSLFGDAWITFLTIAISGLTSLILLTVIANNGGFYWAIPELLWIFLNFAGTVFLSSVFVSFVLGWKKQQHKKSRVDIFSPSLESSKDPAILRTAMFTSIIVVGTLVLVVSTIVGIHKIYEYYNPPEFGIYDI